MTSNINILFDKPKLTLTALDTVEQYDFDIIADKVSEQLKYVSQRLIEGQQETDLPYDKENIILPRQQTYIQKVKDSKFAKKKKNRMVWDENKKNWTLRKLKKRDSVIPPIIEATLQFKLFEFYILILIVPSQMHMKMSLEKRKSNMNLINLRNNQDKCREINRNKRNNSPLRSNSDCLQYIQTLKQIISEIILLVQPTRFLYL